MFCVFKLCELLKAKNHASDAVFYIDSDSAVDFLIFLFCTSPINFPSAESWWYFHNQNKNMICVFKLFEFLKAKKHGSDACGFLYRY